MLKRELKVNLKGFLIWSGILIGLFLIVFLIYPSIINSDDMKLLDQMLEIFPEELLKAFNMDISSIDSAFGWLKTEGFVFIVLLTGVYSGILGSSILLKEENDKTIEYLISVPVTRKKIILSKIICGLIYILLIVLAIGLFNLIGLLLSGEFDILLYFLLSITPLFSSIVIFSVCLFISTFARKTKKTFGISLGIVFASYFLNIISTMSSNVEFFKYFSIFTLTDTRNVILNTRINPLMIIISIVLSMIFLVLSIFNFNKKDL